MMPVTSHLVNDGSDTRICTVNCMDSVDSCLGSPTSSNQFSYLLPNNLSSVIAVFVSSPLFSCEVFCWFPVTKAKLILVPQQVQGSWIRGESSTTNYWSLSSIVYCSGSLDGLQCNSSEVCIHDAKLLGRTCWKCCRSSRSAV